jgi:density-regulated protein
VAAEIFLMAEATAPTPVIVEYDPVTGIPSEYNEFLPHDSVEWKKWKAAQEGPEALEKLTLKDAQGNEIEKQLPGGKVKKKQKAHVVIETNVRNKKKCITTVTGLDSFGVKLSEASKLFGKKFASGASVVKTADGKEQIDIQGDFLSQVAELIIKEYGKKSSIGKGDVYFIDLDKKRVNYFDEDYD